MAAVYLLTGIIALLLYTSRLYSDRSAIRDIPKSYMPIEKNDLPQNRVRHMIEEELARSAVIAYEAKPKHKNAKDGIVVASERLTKLTKTKSTQDVLNLRRKWGSIAHPGWSAPFSPDIPSLYYPRVIAELPDLIEAKAVSLAPAEPLTMPNEDGTTVPDARVVAILQRPIDMGLRDYIAQLSTLGVTKDDELCKGFLALYERARFGSTPLPELLFRNLMGMFAEILRHMTKIDPEVMGNVEAEDFSSADINMESPEMRRSPELQRKDAEEQSVEGKASVSETGSVMHYDLHIEESPPRRVSEDSVPSAPTSDEGDHKSFQDALTSIPIPRPLPVQRLISTNSVNPLRQTRSHTSSRSNLTNGSSSSVIHLAPPGSQSHLPYTLEVP